MNHAVAFLILLVCCPSDTTAFSTLRTATTQHSLQRSSVAHRPIKLDRHVATDFVTRRGDPATFALEMNGYSNDADGTGGFFDDLQINIPYAAAYIFFLGYAYFRSVGEASGASQEVLNVFLADPVNPGCNELFAAVFNLLGLVGIPMACILLPGAKDQKLPAAPFLAGSFFGGFGILGPYTIVRKSRTELEKSELGWFTVNVLENKLFNWAVVGLAISTFFSTGCVSAFADDSAGLISGYGDLFSSTAIASASSVDLFILTLTAASLIPEDLARRGMKEKSSANIIAASTILLPVVGSAIYCALRPSLEVLEEE